MTPKVRTYSELSRLATFEERFDYLMLSGSTGVATFGFDRYLNQAFYRSSEWQSVRRTVVLRDNGCDLGVPGYEISANPLIHHINPMSPEDVLDRADWILDPEFLVTTCTNTHNAIHFGNKDSLYALPVDRSPNDTKLW
jgi:hypothetical protein